jgi:glutathione S-transferase
MVHYKLNYFNGRGRAEPTRLVFAAAGVEYEDFRWEREQWPDHKARSPTGQAPFLEVKDDNGQDYTLFQSVSIGKQIFTFVLTYHMNTFFNN